MHVGKEMLVCIAYLYAKIPRGAAGVCGGAVVFEFSLVCNPRKVYNN
jgi:hypothetical protein